MVQKRWISLENYAVFILLLIEIDTPMIKSDL